MRRPASASSTPRLRPLPSAWEQPGSTPSTGVTSSRFVPATWLASSFSPPERALRSLRRAAVIAVEAVLDPLHQLELAAGEGFLRGAALVRIGQVGSAGMPGGIGG